jgi:hypothetical protein
MADKPVVHAWFMDAPIADDDPLAAVKHRARDIDAAAEIVAWAERTGHTEARADLIDQTAGLIPDEDFDLDTAHDVSGVPWADLDSAGHIALTLAKVERYGALGEDD